MESDKDDLHTQCQQQTAKQPLNYQKHQFEVKYSKDTHQEQSSTQKQYEVVQEKQLNFHSSNCTPADCDQVKKLQLQQKLAKDSSEHNQTNQNQQLICQVKELNISQNQISADTDIQGQTEHKLVVYDLQPQRIKKFSPLYSSKTIRLNQNQDQAEQDKFYYQNFKLILTQPISSMDSNVTFRLDHIKYCVGVGIGLKEIVQKHQYDYKSTTTSEMGHGLYIVTSQGYSWSHSQENQDDSFREGFNSLYSGVSIDVKLEGQNLSFKWKKGHFTMELPSRIRQKYTLCFCAYLHQKTDGISIVQ